jgi:hypothetical protein
MWNAVAVVTKASDKIHAPSTLEKSYIRRSEISPYDISPYDLHYIAVSAFLYSVVLLVYDRNTMAHSRTRLAIAKGLQDRDLNLIQKPQVLMRPKPIQSSVPSQAASSAL